MSSSICGIRVKTKFLVETEQIGRWPEAVGKWMKKLKMQNSARIIQVLAIAVQNGD